MIVAACGPSMMSKNAKAAFGKLSTLLSQKEQMQFSQHEDFAVIPDGMLSGAERRTGVLARMR